MSIQTHHHAERKLRSVFVHHVSCTMSVHHDCTHVYACIHYVDTPCVCTMCMHTHQTIMPNGNSDPSARCTIVVCVRPPSGASSSTRSSIRVTAVPVRTSTFFLSSFARYLQTAWCVHASLQLCTYVPSFEHLRACVRACMHAHACVLACTCLRACTCLHLHACVHACVCACARTHARMCAYLHWRVCMHLHACVCLRACLHLRALTCMRALACVRACVHDLLRACTCVRA